MSAASPLDSNFSASTFANVGSEVTGLAWAPDGSPRLFASRKGGTVTIVKDGAVLPTPFVTVSPLYTGSECGLIGICFDPNFVVNGYVYVFATVSSTEQQILRYQALGDVGTNKTVLLPGLPTAGANHDGGAVGVGPDGKLYWAIGDNGNGTGVDADLTSLASKVGRANLDGSVPADNPFVDGPGGNNDYVWARGFRNPFTFDFQPETGLLWVNCVGTSYEQVFVVRAGDHAGWNDYENNQPAGYITPKIKYRTNGTDTRNLVAGTGAVRVNNVVTLTTSAAHGFRKGERITLAGVADGSFNGSVYVNAVPDTTTFTAPQAGPDATSGGGTAATLNQGGAVTGGCFYDSTAVPPSYRGNYFYGDLNSGRIMRATLDASNKVMTVDYFATGVASAIDNVIGPDGALYTVSHGGTVYRLAYTNFTAQQLVVTPAHVRMVEGGAAVLTVRLATAPAADVTVNVARISGAPTIAVAAGGTLTFGPANWSVPQVVQLRAGYDSDTRSDTAEFSVSAEGMPTEVAMVQSRDVLALEPFSLQVLPPSAGQEPRQIRLEGQSNLTYVLEGTLDFIAPWSPLVTNTLAGSFTNFTDWQSTNLPERFYRARLAP
jgi:glucose/arabinose dehydrogenase